MQKALPVSDIIGIRKSQFYPFVSGIMGIEFFRFRPPVSIVIGKYFAILHPCFRYNGKFFKNVNFRPFPISNGNKTHFLKKSHFHFKRKQAFSEFSAFLIRKEISDRLKILFPFFVPAAAQYIFSAETRKSHSQSGFSDCPWSFPICYDMCVFALYFRYNGNYGPEFFAALFPIEIGKVSLKLPFFKSSVSEKCPCFRLKWELTAASQRIKPRQWHTLYHSSYIYSQTLPTPQPDRR